STILPISVSSRYPLQFVKGALDLPLHVLIREKRALPRVVELALIGRPLGAHPGRPFRHVARLGGVQPEAEAVADPPVRREHARDQGFLAGGEAHRVHVYLVRRFQRRFLFSRRRIGWSNTSATERPLLPDANSASLS